jgi:ATP synthase protein I
MAKQNNLRKQVERQVRRMQKAEHERPTLAGQTVYIGTLGLMFVLPVILGTYLGHWLDSQSGDYSVRWTVGLLLAGVAVGALNVYLFIKE